MSPHGRAFWLTVCLSLLAYPTFADAAPRIDTISLRGLQQGGRTMLTVQGAELNAPLTAWIGQEAVTATVQDGATAEAVTLELELPDSAFPGVRQLRLVNAAGISNAVACVVDELPQAAWSETLDAWPIALSGVCEGGTQRVTTLAGKAGQLLVVEIEARRIGSGLNPSLRVLDEQGSQLAWAQADSRLGGDARLQVELPRDGRYQIELHDTLYRAAAPAHFRLKIADASTHVPPFLRAMNAAEIEARGLESLLGGNFVSGGWTPLRLERASAAPTGLPRLFVSPWRETVENEDAHLAGALSVPVGINGCIGAPDEEDRYTIIAPVGAKLRIECFAERGNSPLDGVLAVRDVAGNQLAAADDQAGTVDPGLEFTMPSDKVVLALRDLRRRGGEDFRYRLSVLPSDAFDAKLTLESDLYTVPRGGTSLVRVHAERQTYAGPIRLHFLELLDGVTAENAEIPAGASDALVTLRNSGAAASGVLQVVGAWGDAAEEQTRAALAPANLVTSFSPWLAREIAIGAGPTAPFSVAWDAATSSDALVLASDTPLRVRVERGAGTMGAVRLSLITTQTPPTKQENNQTVPDMARTLRLASEVVVPADQAEAALAVTVPADLAMLPYDLALKAELLSADGSQVVSTVTSPSLRLQTKTPSFHLAISEPATVTPAAGELQGSLKGKIERPAGFTRPVAVQLSGLPATIPAPSVLVPEGQSDFTLTVSLPGTITLAELSAAKLTASSELAPGVTVSAANEVSLTLSLGAPESGDE